MTTAESRPATSVDAGNVEAPAKNLAAEVINGFKMAIGQPEAIAFSLTTKIGTVTYSETSGKDNTEERRGLHVTIGDEDASANVYSIKGQQTRETIGWAKRDGKSISGSPTHMEDTLETQTKMAEMLSKFLPKQSPKV